MAYDPISMKDTVIQWLKTELRVEKLAVSSYFPAIEFHTNSQHGIYGFYVWDRIMNQKVFTVLFLQETPKISAATPPLD